MILFEILSPKLIFNTNLVFVFQSRFEKGSGHNYLGSREAA